MSKAEEVMSALSDFVVGESVLVPEHYHQPSRYLVSAIITRIWDDDTFNVLIVSTNCPRTRHRKQIRKDPTRWPVKPTRS